MRSTRHGSGTAFEVTGWGILGLIVLINAVLLSTRLQGELLRGPLVDAAVYHLPLFAALVLSSLLFIRSDRGVERKFWGTVTFSFGSLLCAEIYWLWYTATIDSDGPALTHPIILLYGVSCASFIWLVAGLTKPSLSSPWRHVRVLLDVATGAWAVMSLVYLYWTYPLLGRAGGVAASDALIAAVYPTVVVFLLSLVGGYSVLRPYKWWRPWEFIIAIATCVFCTALVLFPIWRATAMATQGPVPLWYTSLLGIGFALIALAEAHRLADGPAGDHVLSEKGVLPEGGPRWLSRFYPVAMSLVLIIVGWHTFGATRDLYGMILILLVVVLAVLLATRSSLAAIEAAAYYRSAHTDPVTGALVRSDFVVALADATSIAQDTRSAVSVVMMGVPITERIGTVIGHSLHDGELKQLLAIATTQMAPCEGPYLLGHYRFAFILADRGAEKAAEEAAAAWREMTRSIPTVVKASDIAFGVADCSDGCADVEEVVARAHVAADDAHAIDGVPVRVYAPDSQATDAEGRVDRIRLRAFREAVKGLAHAVDAREPFTAGHSGKVCDLSTVLAQVMGMGDPDVQIVALAATVHDVGKVGVVQKEDTPAAVGPVAPDAHPVLGEQILAPTHVKEVLPMIRHHHERWDGTGFPDELAGDEIPVGARILAVCNTFVNLTTERPHRPAFSAEDALSAIEAESGSAFDPAVVGTFVRMVRGLGVRSAPTTAS